MQQTWLAFFCFFTLLLSTYARTTGFHVRTKRSVYGSSENGSLTAGTRLLPRGSDRGSKSDQKSERPKLGSGAPRFPSLRPIRTPRQQNNASPTPVRARVGNITPNWAAYSSPKGSPKSPNAPLSSNKDAPRSPRSPSRVTDQGHISGPSRPASNEPVDPQTALLRAAQSRPKHESSPRSPGTQAMRELNWLAKGKWTKGRHPFEGNPFGMTGEYTKNVHGDYVPSLARARSPSPEPSSPKKPSEDDSIKPAWVEDWESAKSWSPPPSPTPEPAWKMTGGWGF